MKAIRGKKSRDIYYYDENTLTLTDKEGNTIKLYESLDGIEEGILGREIDLLFHKFYLQSNEFKTLCSSLKQHSDIIWEELK